MNQRKTGDSRPDLFYASIPRVPAWVWIPCLTAAAVVVGLFVNILCLNNGRFIYALDDPYIHLALSEQIAHFHYGLQPNEAASPASSILWPLLLAPFAPFRLHEYVPLLLNLGCLCAILFVLIRFLALMEMPRWPYGRRMAALVLLLFALGLDLAGGVFLGMEHLLQVLAAVLAGLGLMRFLERGHPDGWWLAVAVLGPLVRYENAVFTAAILLLLLWQRRVRLAFLLGGLAALPLVAFSLFLLALGLPPLPSSVLVKLTERQASGSLLERMLENFLHYLTHPGARLPLAAAALAVLFLVLARERRSEKKLAAVTLMAIGGYFLAGRFGQRYEMALCFFALMMALYLGRDAFRWALAQRWWPVLILPGWLGAVFLFNVHVQALLQTPLACNNIYEQQYQMHRFLTEFHRGPAAVNDLGWPSYRNPHYVLDLWGLGSEEARVANLGKEQGWVQRLVRKHHVSLAMIYREAFPDLPEAWEELAVLRLSRKRVAPAYAEVCFFSTTPAATGALREALAAFSETLPPRVVLEVR